jgi:hypothetical protein
MKIISKLDIWSSARLFDRYIQKFINDVLGFDKNRRDSHASGGLFGLTRVYFGVVEAQGRGTLHLHYVVAWYSPKLDRIR